MFGELYTLWLHKGPTYGHTYMGMFYYQLLLSASIYGINNLTDSIKSNSAGYFVDQIRTRHLKIMPL